MACYTWAASLRMRWAVYPFLEILIIGYNIYS